MLVEVLEYCSDKFGEAHERTLAAVHALAVLLMQEGSLEAAAPLQRRALEGRSELLGESHFDTIESRERLALLLQAQGRVAEDPPEQQDGQRNLEDE